MEPKDLAKLQNDARTTLVQALGGAVLLIGLYFTLRNLQLTQDRQITEHYTRAVEQLGSDKLAVRLGAIYALERIARDSERDHWPIMEILTACVREHAPWLSKPTPPQQDGQSALKLRPTPEIQAILTVLGRRTRTFGKGENQRLELGYTDLRGAAVQHAHLEGAQLWQAHLEGAYLETAHLEGADLGDAHLEGARLENAHLEGAQLGNAHLEGAYLGGTHLEGADLWRTHLEGTTLWRAHLEGVKALIVEQLAAARTLYQAHLDLPLLEQIQREYPHLLEKPED